MKSKYLKLAIIRQHLRTVFRSKETVSVLWHSSTYRVMRDKALLKAPWTAASYVYDLEVMYPNRVVPDNFVGVTFMRESYKDVYNRLAREWKEEILRRHFLESL